MLDQLLCELAELFPAYAIEVCSDRVVVRIVERELIASDTMRFRLTYACTLQHEYPSVVRSCVTSDYDWNPVYDGGATMAFLLQPNQMMALV